MTDDRMPVTTRVEGWPEEWALSAMVYSPLWSISDLLSPVTVPGGQVLLPWDRLTVMFPGFLGVMEMDVHLHAAAGDVLYMTVKIRCSVVPQWVLGGNHEVMSVPGRPSFSCVNTTLESSDFGPPAYVVELTAPLTSFSACWAVGA